MISEDNSFRMKLIKVDLAAVPLQSRQRSHLFNSIDILTNKSCCCRVPGQKGLLLVEISTFGTFLALQAAQWTEILAYRARDQDVDLCEVRGIETSDVTKALLPSEILQSDDLSF